jgi:hypothetical protein
MRYTCIRNQTAKGQQAKFLKGHHGDALDEEAAM